MTSANVNIVDYKGVERYSLKLAEKVRAVLGDALQTARFIAIPRGGLIVLGVLSYCLGLKREQLEIDPMKSPASIVVVDDCCLSGARFSGFIEPYDFPKIIFAHLFSTPQVRDAITKNETRVEACLAAEDLVELVDPTSPDLQAIYWEKLPGRRHWLGRVHHIVFPWSEPDGVLWNEKKGKIEDNWHRAPPRKCLAARVELGVPISDAPTGSIDVPIGIVWKIDGDEVTLWDSNSDKVYVLKETSSLMWRALAAYGNENAVYEYLLTQYDVEKETLKHDLDMFFHDLLTKGLLVENGAR